MRRAVFLDRDGVVNRAVLKQGKPYPPATVSDLRLLPGVREACKKLQEAGFALILITNQPDIARGLVSAEQVSEMNRRLQRFLQLDGVGVCPHDDAARCSCRKPQPGLLLEAARVWNIDLESSSSWAIDGAISKPAIAPGAAQYSSTTATPNSARMARSSASARCAKLRNGFSEPLAREC